MMDSFRADERAYNIALDIVNRNLWAFNRYVKNVCSL